MLATCMHGSKERTTFFSSKGAATLTPDNSELVVATIAGTAIVLATYVFC